MEVDEDSFDLNTENNDDEEEIEVTPAEVIDLMEESWLNEKFSPEVLPHKTEIVDCLLEQITHMEENLQTVSSTHLKKSIHQMEVDRLRFLVSSYLRTRLEKIETYATHILSQEEERFQQGQELYLNKSELSFARDFSQGLDQYFENITSFYPGLLTDDLKNPSVAPNIHSFVFLKSKGKVEGVVIDDGDVEDGDLVDLTSGSQMIISYNSVSNLLKKGDVHLI